LEPYKPRGDNPKGVSRRLNMENRRLFGNAECLEVIQEGGYDHV
jgi:hypothetical protein